MHRYAICFCPVKSYNVETERNINFEIKKKFKFSAIISKIKFWSEMVVNKFMSSKIAYKFEKINNFKITTFTLLYFV